RADDRSATPSAAPANPFEAATRQPLSAKTWPIWREAYVRTFFDDNRDPEPEKTFYEQVRAFFGATAAASGASLPKGCASDPIAWAARAWTDLHRAADGLGGAAREQDLTRGEDASRKGIALGDPQAIASYTLAAILVSRGRFQGPHPSMTRDLERRLTEAE